MPSAPGAIHLHPAYQQHEFVIGDGLQILKTSDATPIAPSCGSCCTRVIQRQEGISAGCLGKRVLGSVPDRGTNAHAPARRTLDM
jgi:hypothetical protein